MNCKGVTGISYVIILISVLVAATLIGYMFITLSKRMTNRPFLRVLGATVTGDKLSISIVNDGTVDYSGPLQIIVKGGSVTKIETSNGVSVNSDKVQVNIPAGSGIFLTCTVTFTQQPQNYVDGTIVTTEGNLNFRAIVSKSG